MQEGTIGRVKGRSLADLQPATLDTNTATVRATVSTGERVWRGRFYEQLDVEGSDLTALQEGAPVFLDHRHKADSVVGRIQPNSVQVRDGKIEADISFNTETSVWPLLRDGHLTQLSVGYAVLDAAEDTADDGNPVQKVTRWQPLEASVVGLGAERGARLRSADGGDDVPDPEWRVDMAARAHADGDGELASRILNTDMGQKGITNAMHEMKQRTQGDPVQPHVHSNGGFDGYDAICRSAPEALASMVDGREPQDEYAKQLRGLGPLGIAREVLTQRGDQGVRFMSPSQIASRAMGHSTSDFPTLLTEAGNRSLVEQYQAARSSLTAITRTNDTITDFREVSRIQVGAPPELKKVGEHGEIQHGTTDERAERYSLDTYATMFSISRQALINDDLGAFGDYLAQMARAATTFEADKIAKTLTDNPAMADGVPLFDADHDNVVSTSQSIDVNGLDAARSLMRAQTDSKGHPLNLGPSSIVVAAEDETQAQKIIASITPDQPSNVNPFSNALSVLPEARLNGEGKFWLFASPSVGPVLEVGFLNGNRGPQLESREGWNVLGLEMRMVFDFGIGVIDHRGAVQVPKA